MRKPVSFPRTRGFSLVEMLVAVVFMSVLMAGMATVFKSSLSAFVTNSEGLSNARRNRLALDMFQDDLNSAGMYLENLIAYPKLAVNNPGFYIIPNRPILNDAGDPVAAGGTLPTLTDEVYIYMDSALPKEATLDTLIPGLDSFVAGGGTMPTTPQTFDILFDDEETAKSVQAGQYVVFKDWFHSRLISSVVRTDKKVTVTPDPNPQLTAPESSATYYDKFQHPKGAGVVVVNRARMVRYRIKAKALDPSGTLIPCLVREELPYNPSGDANDPATVFPVATADQIITEDVSSFKVYLSGNQGAAWAGLALPTTTNDFANGWTLGILTGLQAQVPTYPIMNDNNWYRTVPTLIRVDLKTRTPIKRSEYLQASQNNVTAGFRDRLQSFVVMPRHFGLPY